jgi:hypothetical protein
MIYVSADRTVRPCCPHSAIGVLSEEMLLSDILNGPEIRALRRSLLEGDLDAECASCPTRPLTDPESLRRKVRVQLAKAAQEAVKA